MCQFVNGREIMFLRLCRLSFYLCQDKAYDLAGLRSCVFGKKRKTQNKLKIFHFSLVFPCKVKINPQFDGLLRFDQVHKGMLRNNGIKLFHI